MRIAATLLIALFLARPAAQSNPDAAAITRHIEQELAGAKIPGAGIAVVAGDSVFAGSYGVADFERGEAMTPATLMHAGSINKMFTALAVTSTLTARKIPLSSTVGQYL